MLSKTLNKIHLGDSMELMKELPDNCVNVVVTDPPYKFEVHERGIAQKRDYLKNGFKDIQSSADIDIYNDDFIDTLQRICTQVNFFFFCNKSQIFDILSQANKRGWNFEIVVLLKNTPTPLTNNQWLPDKEYGIHVFKSIKVYGDYSTKKSFFLDNNFKNKDYDHPTVKPIEVIKRIISNISKEGEVILDPFMGSGTTANACINLNRQFLGYEISEKYHAIATERIKKAKGNFGLFEETAC